MKFTDEGSAQTAKHEGLIQMTQVTPAVASKNVVASYQIAAWPSVALAVGLYNGGEQFHLPG